jgi:methylated-DNA-protein-cysteine methyltransferase-like protein
VYSFVAQLTHGDAALQGLAVEALAEARSAMHLARDQVVERQYRVAAAQGAFTGVLFHGHGVTVPAGATMNQHGDERESQLYAWMAQIPRGRVVTYGQLAKLVGLPNGARWVGRQMGRLPQGSSLPWYRVINAQGRSSIPLDATGWNRQLRLLKREGVVVNDGRISLSRFQWDPFAEG